MFDVQFGKARYSDIAFTITAGIDKSRKNGVVEWICDTNSTNTQEE
jgi:hypothetical protein